ncbi:hypothetical protein [Paenibacillus xerothermodurans]|nr:hypothetical protein [Paenibacillus xerothermodurans]
MSGDDRRLVRHASCQEIRMAGVGAAAQRLWSYQLVTAQLGT